MFILAFDWSLVLDLGLGGGKVALRASLGAEPSLSFFSNSLSLVFRLLFVSGPCAKEF